MRDPKKEKKAKKELRRMFKELSKRSQVDSYFEIGKFEASNVLADGTLVKIAVIEPRTHSKAKLSEKKFQRGKKDKKAEAVANGA
jgi:hypothetical protein